ncbi:hypothetical protein BGW38_010000, partial [Lunasporangiospora selenospora]
DVRPPMKDEEGPVQLWLAQHGPVRMRRRRLDELYSSNDEHAGVLQESARQDPKEEEEEEDSSESESEEESLEKMEPEDHLPRIATKSLTIASTMSKKSPISPSTPLSPMSSSPTSSTSSSGGGGTTRYYGGSHLPPTGAPYADGQPRTAGRCKVAKRPMGLEAELPYGCEVRTAQDSQGNSRAELDLLLVERESGIAYRTGYKVVYSQMRESPEWSIDVIG